ncbi:MAG: bifunctional UDP-N-acetylglucosamine diphosphorylase/glucosamine-1-phosphate N-acetyltransferase GlmU [Gammaproteobacteria bacterium]|nr:bifunctional UDP-N-acetylglucosamine diphosphorylase/glucosamine-1-phosphate N-acetyltransferase GlmU [Gammaproteobacteria bacterium]
MPTIDAIILAAGEGSRMNSNAPKVLQQLSDKALLQYVIDAAVPLGAKLNIVIGHCAKLVKASVFNENVNWVVQKEQLGTGHAVQQVMPDIDDDSICLVLYGDVPLIQSVTLKTLIEQANSSGFALLSVVLENPTGYGRIKRDAQGEIIAIVEQKDASKSELKINEINTGIMAVKASLLRDYLDKLKPNNAQGELYLTDIVEMANANNVTISSCICDYAAEVMGVNDKNQLAELERLLQQKQVDGFMADGLGVRDPARFDCRGTLCFGKDCIIDINVVFEGDNELGSNVTIAPNCIIKNAKIGDNSEIKANSLIEDSTVGSNTAIGPFARLRPESHIGNSAKIGNFVEIKKSTIGNTSKVSHLSYVGDSTIGEGVNVGAGVITCNYDGANKYQTIIKDGAFIGSDTQLIAPVTIGKNATIGAGATITKDVPDESLSLSRNKQTTLSNWQRPSKK